MRSLAVAGLLLLAALMLVPALLGYERYVVTGASMEPSLPRGSIVYEERVAAARLRPGDVITYTPPGRAGRVTHRVVSAEPGGRLRTKGDANPAPDPWWFKLAGREQPVVRFHVPLAGYAFVALGERWVRILVIGLPALAVAVAAPASLRPREGVPA